VTNWARDPARLKLAVHEAGHAVAAVLLGRTVEGVSIEIHAGLRGVCIDRRSGPVDVTEEANFTTGVFLMPWQARQDMEAKLATLLAGPIAEAVYAPGLPAGYESPASLDREHARRIISARLELPEKARALFENHDELRSDYHRFRDDRAQAFQLSKWVSSGTSFALAFQSWFALEVEAWVRRESFRAPLAALTLELLEQGELPGPRVHELVAAAATTDLGRRARRRGQPREARRLRRSSNRAAAQCTPRPWSTT
jgi:hypothetical protein